MAKRSTQIQASKRPPTEDESRLIKAALDNIVRDRPPRLKVALDGTELSSPHSDFIGHLTAMLDAMGTRSSDFLAANLGQLEAITRTRGATRGDTSAGLGAGFAIVQAIEPDDELEAALAVQIAAAHATSLNLMSSAAQTDRIDQLQVYANLATKFQRTMTLQIEALAKLRGKGQQTVRVEHVNVQPGGQAIVGDVHYYPDRGEGRRRKLGKQCHATARSAGERVALPGPDPERDGVPVPSRPRKAKVQNARRE